MNNDVSIRRAQPDRFGQRPTSRSRRSGPDKVAFWALLIALLTMVAAAASAQAGSGGISGSPAGSKSSGKAKGGGADRCAQARFGKRELRLGDCGRDVKTLHWLLKANEEGRRVKSRPMFVRRTDSAVRRIQQRSGLRRSGIVDKKTRKVLVKRMSRDVATWYGPGFWGNRTACGQRLKRGTVGVAHKQLPCGTKVTIKYKGRFVRTKVIDRGPYAHGAQWDLTQAAAEKLRMTTTSTIRAAVIR